jgi:hypothetical protein
MMDKVQKPSNSKECQINRVVTKEDAKVDRKEGRETV